MKIHKNRGKFYKVLQNLTKISSDLEKFLKNNFEKL